MNYLQKTNGYQMKPKHFKVHEFKRTYQSPYSESEIWDWLNDPKTFSNNQVWPFRVEFLKSQEHRTDFETGVQNNHHGPLLSLAGEIGEISKSYRDLNYYYGSYAISFRIIRPFRLEFWSEDQKDSRQVTVKLSSYVAPSFYTIWNWSQGIFLEKVWKLDE